MFGGIYALRQELGGLILEESGDGSGEGEGAEGAKVTGVRTASGQLLRCKRLAGHVDALAGLLLGDPIGSQTLPMAHPRERISRAVCIADGLLQVRVFERFRVKFLGS